MSEWRSRMSLMTQVFAVVALSLAVSAPVAAQVSACGSESFERGDLELVELQVSSPDAQGRVSIEVGVRFALAPGVPVPRTMMSIADEGAMHATLELGRISSINNVCVGQGWGTNCAGACPTIGCAGGTGACDCLESVNGSYSACRCVIFLSKGFSFPGTSGSILTVTLDHTDEFEEDDECNNVRSIVIP